MKFFKKRLNKRKLTKSLTETALIAPPTTTAHQHDNNKPLPPSPSLASMPQQAPTASVAAKDAEATNSDSWLELNLPNDFSSSLDIPQLQTTSNPLEINTSKSLVQESESITETSLFSYPDNHIDTTTDDEPSKPDEQEKSVASVAATLEPSSSARPDHVDRDNQQDESPLQPVEKQGDTLLNDTCRDAIVLVNATLIPTDAMQHMELEETNDLLEKENSAEEEQAAVELDVFLAATAAPTVSTLTLVVDTVIEPGDNAEETQSLHSSISADKDTLEIASPVEMCSSTIDNENLDDLQTADSSSPTTCSPPPPEMTPTLLATEPSSQAASTEESSLQDSQGDTFKIAKRKSAISLIPRSKQQQQSVHVLPDANAKKDGNRRASSSSFIPVLATRHQHASVCLMPSKDAALATTVPVTWSPSSSSERNSVSSDSASSCGSQHQEKRTSLIAKPSANQQQLLVLQSKIPKASFGMPLTANTEISKAVPTTTTTALQQHVSRLPTKRNSTLA